LQARGLGGGELFYKYIYGVRVGILESNLNSQANVALDVRHKVEKIDLK